MAKMGNALVAMCSVAVGLIYAGAYEVTANQANPQNTSSAAENRLTSSAVVNSNSDSSAQMNSNAGNTNNAGGTGNPGNPGSSGDSSMGNPPSNTTVKKNNTSGYKDGVFTGFGQDRRGTLQVAVTIKQGKISGVEVSNYDMRYSESYIDPILPQEVVRQQNDNVDVVSGATASSENFQMAVQQALDQAKQG